MSRSASSAQGRAPGIDPHDNQHARSYLIGLGYALVLTLASFWAASTPLVYAPGVPVLLGVLAIAQMGVHLAFFLHISSTPDQANNFLALAFGIFVTGLVVPKGSSPPIEGRATRAAHGLIYEQDV